MRYLVLFLLNIVLGVAPTEFLSGENNTLILAGTLSFSGSDDQRSRSLECLQGFDLVSNLSQLTPYQKDRLGTFTVEFSIWDDGGDEASVSQFYANFPREFNFLLGPHGTSLSRVAAQAAEYPMMLHSAPNSGIFNITNESSMFSIDARHEWMVTAVAWFAEQGARSILAVIDDTDVTNEKCEGVLRVAERYGLDNLGVSPVRTNVQLVSLARDLGNKDPDIVVTCLDLAATYRLLVESRFLGFDPRVAWIADQNLTTGDGVDLFGIHVHTVVGAKDKSSNTTLCWRDGDLTSFQRQFWAMHGTVASDTALRCATAAHTIATVVALDSGRSVEPDYIASLLSNLDKVTTCYGILFLNGSHVESDDLVMQLDIHETIEDARVRRHWTEAELTYPGRGWDEKDADIYPCEVGTFMRTAPLSVSCEPCAKGRSRPKLVVPHCVTCGAGRYALLEGESTCHDCSDRQRCLEQGLSTTPEAQPGHFRTGLNYSALYWECNPREMCLGASCLGVNDGFMCSSCPQGYARAGAWAVLTGNVESGECYVCSSKLWIFFWLFWVILHILFFACVKHMATTASTRLEKMFIPIVRLFVDWFQLASIVCLSTRIFPLGDENKRTRLLIWCLAAPLLAFVYTEDSCFLSDLGVSEVHALLGLGVAMLPVCLLATVLLSKIGLIRRRSSIRQSLFFEDEEHRVSVSAPHASTRGNSLLFASHFHFPPQENEEHHRSVFVRMQTFLLWLTLPPHRRSCGTASVTLQDNSAAQASWDGEMWRSMLVVLLYSPSMQLLCSVLDCDVYEVRRHRANLELECSLSPLYVCLLAAFVVYGFGIPLYVMRIWVWRRHLLEVPVRRCWSFYFDGFRQEMCYWEGILMLRKFAFCSVIALKEAFTMSAFLVSACAVSLLVNKRNKPFDGRNNFLLERLDACMLWTITMPSVFRLWITASETEEFDDVSAESKEYLDLAQRSGTVVISAVLVIVWVRFAVFLVVSVVYDFFISHWQKADTLCPEILTSWQRFSLRCVSRPGLLTMHAGTDTLDLSNLSHSERKFLSRAMTDLSMVYMNTIEDFSSPENAVRYSSYHCVGALRMSYVTCVLHREKLAKQMRSHYTIRQLYRRSGAKSTIHVTAPKGVTVTEMQVALLKACGEIRERNDNFFYSPSKMSGALEWASHTDRKNTKKLAWTNQSTLIDFLNELEAQGMIQLHRHHEDDFVRETEPVAEPPVEQTLATLGLSPVQPQRGCAASELFQQTRALVQEITDLRLQVDHLEQKWKTPPTILSLPDPMFGLRHEQDDPEAIPRKVHSTSDMSRVDAAPADTPADTVLLPQKMAFDEKGDPNSRQSQGGGAIRPRPKSKTLAPRAKPPVDEDEAIKDFFGRSFDVPRQRKKQGKDNHCG